MLGGLTALAAVLTVGLILLAVTSAPGTASNGFRPAQLFVSSSGVSITTRSRRPSSPTARIDRWLRADHSSLTRPKRLSASKNSSRPIVSSANYHASDRTGQEYSYFPSALIVLVRRCQRSIHSLFNGEYERQQHRPRRVAASLGNDRNGALPPTRGLSSESMIRCMRQQAFLASRLPRAPLR